MICNSCEKERLVSDFINNQKFCYHCEYRIKLEKSREKRTQEEFRCRTCGHIIVHKKNLKKRQRTVFCSSECASQGHKNQLNNHWTRKIRIEDSWTAGGRSKWNINQK